MILFIFTETIMHQVAQGNFDIQGILMLTYFKIE